MEVTFHEIDIAIYEHKVIVLVTQDPDAVQRAIDHYGLQSLFDLSNKDRAKIVSGRGGYSFIGDRYRSILWLGKYPDGPYNESVLVHEAIHVAVAILDDIGIPLKKSCDEALTYLVDFIYRETRLALQYGRDDSRTTP